MRQALKNRSCSKTKSARNALLLFFQIQIVNSQFYIASAKQSYNAIRHGVNRFEIWYAGLNFHLLTTKINCQLFGKQEHKKFRAFPASFKGLLRVWRRPLSVLCVFSSRTARFFIVVRDFERNFSAPDCERNCDLIFSALS